MPNRVRLPSVAPLAGDHDGEVTLLEPAEQAAELAADDGLVREGAEQNLDRVEYDALGANRLDGHLEPDEQPLQVEGTRLDDLRGVEPEGVDSQQAVALELLQVEAEGGHVGDQVVLGLLEGEHHPGLAEVPGTPDQELDAEHGLSRARSPRHERRSTSGETTIGDLVEAGDPGRRLLRTSQHARFAGAWFSLGCHRSPRPPLQSLLPHQLFSLRREDFRRPKGGLGGFDAVSDSNRHLRSLTRVPGAGPPKKPALPRNSGWRTGPRRGSCACLPLANAGSGSPRAPSGGQR